ncbi:transcription factor ORG2-like [Macadamia integrifolia]|uniref:transcription factor ORG2-like n=1 Tax=Macadamia integrifolia TaxID=60698 RepID=UPI001C501944|nr:transcription factor ORG2-like [Macadamia integrifolia]
MTSPFKSKGFLQVEKIDPMGYSIESCNLGETAGTLESFLSFPLSQPQIEFDESMPSTTIRIDSSVIKKLSHNASERDRRKKMNILYSALRALLPATDQTKKLSIPATISRILKYIPDLRKQVERLKQRKEEIQSIISRQGDQPLNTENQSQGTVGTSLPTVSASQIDDDKEVLIQICTYRDSRSPLSEALLYLEEEGLQVLNASGFASFGDTIFYNFHLQIKESRRMECEILIQKLLLMFGKREDMLDDFASR